MSSDDVIRGAGRRGFLGSVAVGGLAAPAVHAAPAKRKVIFVAHAEIPFFNQVKAGFRDFGNLRGWDMQYVARGTPPVIADVVRFQAEAIAAKPDALAFTRINETSFEDNIRRALDQRIPLVLFNIASAGYKQLGVNAFVGQDFIPAGRINGLQAAIHAVKLGRRDGVILVGLPAINSTALDERARGTQEGIEAYNRAHGTTFVVERLQTSNIQRDAIARIEPRIKALGGKLAGFTDMVSGHQFMSPWLEQNGMKGKIANGGFDLVPGVLEAIKTGGAQWTIGQNPYAQGWVTSSLLDMQMESGYPASDYDTGAEVVDATNIDRIIKREARFA
ncbi:substrate-binding domain-containing protein [Pelomonas sp. KK5]|uniref:substrate-binding domain-containing protein n=1 Tax=Pelomonas sp. KK5 TaxID=1855730 RepID=UPI0018E9EFF7|nr:substrate-binding domain-containing protein [Pelomonas sp. KK5]